MKTLHEAYNAVMRGPTEESKQEEKQKSMSYMLTIANELFDIGSRIKSGNITPNDAEYLIEASVEIEEIYNKYLSVWAAEKNGAQIIGRYFLLGVYLLLQWFLLKFLLSDNSVVLSIALSYNGYIIN